MSDREHDEVRSFWNRVAADWQIQVGDEGDANRRLNSDPVLWEFAGDLRGLRVLDAGCGTGYLSRKLHERGAHVTGVDLSDEMIEIARATSSREIEFHVDSTSELQAVEDETLDRVIANYVLMDTPDLTGTMRAFHRVLNPGGVAVVVFSHPCFPQGRAEAWEDGEPVRYVWDFPYFEERKCTDPPWGHFSTEFIWFHRPLSDYWKAFTGAGFSVTDFEEPRIAPERYHLADTERRLWNSRTRPYSVAFRLEKAEPTR